MCKLDRVDWFDGSFDGAFTIAECVDAVAREATFRARLLPRRKRWRCVVVTFDDTTTPAKITDRACSFADMLAKCDPFQRAV